MYVCNYKTDTLSLEINGESFTFRPGPNYISSETWQTIQADVTIQSKIQDGTLEVVQDLDEVRWDIIPEPYRSGWMNTAYERIVHKARLKELTDKQRALGDAIRKMNTSAMAALGKLKAQVPKSARKAKA